MPCRALLILFTLCAPIATSYAEVRSGEYLYDARMSFLKAGELALNLNRFGHEYEVQGEFQTSQAMSAYYSWNGIFAARGRWEAQGPVTAAYMSRTVSKDDDLKIVVNSESGARRLDGPRQDFETIDKPRGNDLISALFFTPTCYSGGVVHDGEDAYQLSLRSQKTQQYNGGTQYYRGEVVNCDYTVIDHKDRKRRVVVSLAQVGDTTMAVQVRAKIPVLPDAIFKLRVPTSKPSVVPQIAMAGR
jgi:hypothetical protein